MSGCAAVQAQRAVGERSLGGRGAVAPAPPGRAGREGAAGTDAGDSLLIGSDTAWAKAAAARFPPKVCRNPLAWLRYCRGVLQRLRDDRHGGEVWEWDTWRAERLDIGGRYRHQPVRRIYFAEIEPDWLKALAKRWARWRLTTVTKSPASIAVSTSSLRRFTSWLADRGEQLGSPSRITRRVLEDYRAHVHTLPVSAMRQNGLLTDLKVFLDDVRPHEWAPGLPANATYYRGEIPAKQRAMPRFINEFVMGQIDNDTSLAELPDETLRTLLIVLIETGLRSVDARHLPFDPVTIDQAGAPYLRFRNYKLSRETIIPISQRLIEQIRRQQIQLRSRYGFDPPLLLPRKRANPTGERAMDGHYVNLRIARWMTDRGIRDASGRPVWVTSHQFRHTLGTRMINNEVPLETGATDARPRHAGDDRPRRDDQRPDVAARVGALHTARQRPRRADPARAGRIGDV